MDAGREKDKKTERWYLHVQGRTVGPLAGEEVSFGLKTGEFLPADKIANARHPIWRRISEHPVFGKQVASDAVPRSEQLQAPPPPRLLRVKPVTPPPKVPDFVPSRPPAEAAPEPEQRPMAAPEPESKIQAEPAAEQKAETVAQPEPKQAVTAPAGASAFSSSPDDYADDPETNASLEAATRELERVLSSLREPVPSPRTPGKASGKKELSAAIPARPEVQPVFLAEPAPRRASPRHPEKAAGSQERRVIQIELKFPERPIRWLALAALVFGIAYYAGIFARKDSAPSAGLSENKTRDLKEFPLPDPSSPTNTPSEAGDPVPPLKAPTRPQRD